MRLKKYWNIWGLWERFNNPQFKGVEFDPLLAEARSDAFTMSHYRWIETTNAIGLISKNDETRYINLTKKPFKKFY